MRPAPGAAGQGLRPSCGTLLAIDTVFHLLPAAGPIPKDQGPWPSLARTGEDLLLPPLKLAWVNQGMKWQGVSRRAGVPP